MANVLDEVRSRTSDPSTQRVHVALTRTEMALIIEALLQAEMTLPLLDRRYMSLKPLEHLRFQQLTLANQLEDMMADAGRQRDRDHPHPVWEEHWRSAQP